MSQLLTRQYGSFTIKSASAIRNAFALLLAVSRHLNLYRFNSLARILRAWPDYPEEKNV
jgi:hypothetical protein